MPGSAYFVPTPEASLTATAARSLQGLACGSCNGRRKMSWYLPGVLSPAQLAGFGDRLPPSLSAFSAAYTYPVDGLGHLGAGAGTGRFNRSVSRGIYELPFLAVPGQGSAGLGQLAVDPTLLLVGIGALALGVYFLGSKRGPRRHGRLRRRLAELGT